MSDPLEERVVAPGHPSRPLPRVPRRHDRAADGSRATRDVVGHPGAVAVLALDDEDRLLMVRQWRVPADGALLEIPAGTLDVHDGVTEDPDLCARRELEEETGLGRATWRKLGVVLDAPGFATELMHLYLATGMTARPTDDDRLGARRGRATRAAARCRSRRRSRWSNGARSATRSRSSGSCGSTGCAPATEGR